MSEMSIKWLMENDEELDGDNWLIIDTSTDNHDVMAIVPKTGDEDYDNTIVYPRARLIAAAPELLAALQEIDGLLSTDPQFTNGNSKVHYCAHKARVAIAQTVE